MEFTTNKQTAQRNNNNKWCLLADIKIIDRFWYEMMDWTIFLVCHFLRKWIFFLLLSCLLYMYSMYFKRFMLLKLLNMKTQINSNIDEWLWWLMTDEEELQILCNYYLLWQIWLRLKRIIKSWTKKKTFQTFGVLC